MPCADVAMVKAKPATAINLSIISSHVHVVQQVKGGRYQDAALL
jgi:hypothetical protein